MNFMPINLRAWIDEHRELLKPPVGNQVIWKDREFIIMVVGGPNLRKDFHINQGEEFFYQLEGDITLRVWEGGRIQNIPIREGEVFLLPQRVPHSPQRPSGTRGLVLERRRQANEKDAFVWYCERCENLLYSESIELKDIVKDLPPLFDRFYSSVENRTCKRCGHVATKGEAVEDRHPHAHPSPKTSEIQR